MSVSRFNRRLHLVCTPDGLLAAFGLLPAAYHDLTPVHELTVALPSGARVLADRGCIDSNTAASILKATGVRLIARPRKNMRSLDWIDAYELDEFRRRMKPLTVSWKAWAFSAFMPVLILVLNSSFMRPYLLCPLSISTSNHGYIGIPGPNTTTFKT